MNDFNDNIGAAPGPGGETGEASSNIFLNLAEKDSVTGIPSLKQAPVSAISSVESDSKMNVQIVIAATVLAIGAGAIYAMRYIGMQAGLDDQAVSIDYTADSNSADFSKRFSSVMRELDKSSTSVEITDHDAFAESPFDRPHAEDEEVIVADPGMSEEERLALQRQRDLELEQQRRRDLVIGEAMRFKVQGILGGSSPAARVSGQAVRAGMKLGEYFTVAQITGRTIIIEADGMRFELAMGKETVRLED